MDLHFAKHIITANTINIEVARFHYSMLHAQNPTLSGNNIFLRDSVCSVYPLKRQPTAPTIANIMYHSVFIFMMYFILWPSEQHPSPQVWRAGTK